MWIFVWNSSQVATRSQQQPFKPGLGGSMPQYVITLNICVGLITSTRSQQQPSNPGLRGSMPQYVITLNICVGLITSTRNQQQPSNLVWEGACHRNLNEVCYQFPIFTWKHTQNLCPRHHLGCDPEWKFSRGGSFTLKFIRVLLDTSLTDHLMEKREIIHLDAFVDIYWMNCCSKLPYAR